MRFRHSEVRRSQCQTPPFACRPNPALIEASCRLVVHPAPPFLEVSFEMWELRLMSVTRGTNPVVSRAKGSPKGRLRGSEAAAHVSGPRHGSRTDEGARARADRGRAAPPPHPRALAAPHAQGEPPSLPHSPCFDCFSTPSPLSSPWGLTVAARSVCHRWRTRWRTWIWSRHATPAPSPRTPPSSTSCMSSS